MYEKVEKPKENESRSVANSVTQNKSNKKPGFGFVDNRPEAVAQRKLLFITNYHTAQNRHPIQRSIHIGENEYSVDEILKELFKLKEEWLISDVREADAIEEVLNTYFEENKEFDSFEAVLEAAREELAREDEEGEQQGLFESEREQIDESLQHTYGRQSDVQAKMVEITHLKETGSGLVRCLPSE